MKIHTKIYSQILLIFGLLLSSFGAEAKQPTLQFNKNGKFKIVQLTDIHYVYQDKSSEKALERILKIIDLEEPDLIMVTGDLIFGKPGDKSMLTVMYALSSRKIPLAITYGNHDDEQGFSREELLKLIKEVPYNLTSTTKNLSGVTNYLLEIKASDSKKTSAVFYVFDSHSYSQIKGIEGYDYIKLDQINWYRKTSQQFAKKNNNKPLFSLAFFHIPTPEFKEATLKVKDQLKGNSKEDICCPQLNSGLFSTIKEQDDIKGIFVGHDHDNDFCTKWHNVLLAYGRYSGGETVYNNLTGNGARIIEITEGKDDFKTWIRTLNGVSQIINYPSDFPEVIK